MKNVINHLLQRSGKSGPFDDGRKIALVLPGGLMSGVRGAGAMIALQELGLTAAFDSIFTASAGFANASYFLGENPKLGASIYYEELAGRNFINPMRFWNPVKFEKVIEAFRVYKPVDYQKLWQTKTELFFRVRRNKDGKIYYFAVKDFDESDYFNLLEASISFPFISKGGKINGTTFTDGQITNRDTREHLLYPTSTNDYTDFLIIYNNQEQRLVNFDGSKKIVEITPQKPLSKFETHSQILKESCDAMTKQVLQRFNY